MKSDVHDIKKIYTFEHLGCPKNIIIRSCKLSIF